jgi:hypothetical protein
MNERRASSPPSSFYVNVEEAGTHGGLGRENKDEAVRAYYYTENGGWAGMYWKLLGRKDGGRHIPLRELS